MGEERDRTEGWDELRVQRLREMLAHVEADRHPGDPAVRAIRSLLEEASTDRSDDPAR